MGNSRVVFVVLSFIFSSFVVTSDVLANNLDISNVRLGSRDPVAKTVTVLLDIAWDNSWRNKINHDAAWLTVRLSDAQVSSGEKRLCRLSAAGISPAGFSSGSNPNAELYIPVDKTGAFIRPAAHQEVSSFSSKNVMLTVNYGSGGFSDSSTIAVNVVGLEMVLIPEGAFYAGDLAYSQASLRQGASDNDPWEITGNAPVSVSAAESNGYFYVSGGHNGEFATGASFVIPQEFPKGFSAFYVMKYEITEGLWVDFINSLPAAARNARDLTDVSHKNSDAVLFRNTIACSGLPLACSTRRPFRAVSYLSWKDLSAFLDWAGLRPLTELEFEKTARGPSLPLSGEFAWGTTAVVPALALNGTAEEGDETAATMGANANVGDQVLTGGDAANGVGYQKGALRSGIFSTDASTRVLSGAGNYGAMELSGNLAEWVVTIGNAGGLVFTGVNGDGYLTTVPGFEGNADVEGWPGMDINAGKGVTSSVGAGFRGGSWQDSTARLAISDRAQAALAQDNAGPTYGGRGARSVDGQ